MVTARKYEMSNSPQEPAAQKEKKQRHPFRTGVIVGALVTIAMTLLIIQNGDRVKVEWFFLDFTWPLWVALLLSFVAGMAAWQLLLQKIRKVNRATLRQAADRARVVVPFRNRDD